MNPELNKDMIRQEPLEKIEAERAKCKRLAKINGIVTCLALLSLFLILALNAIIFGYDAPIRIFGDNSDIAVLVIMGLFGVAGIGAFLAIGFGVLLEPYVCLQ